MYNTYIQCISRVLALEFGPFGRLASSTLATVTFSFFREQEGQGAPTENILNGKNQIGFSRSTTSREYIAKQRKEKATVTFKGVQPYK